MEPIHFRDLIPIELIYGIVAILGGFARYLNAYINGAKFKISILLASGFVSGFGGLMFGFLGQSMQLPFPMLLIMAGIGGVYSDQTMKFLFEYITGKIEKSKINI